ncbi:four-helix bundle copper-binding protein [Tranquillimonas alkanivorans]|uniref:Four-helix bundle copper-binding protein n=1 Tax=Tranquillimonas alkanivorans TaxID=441119 RepID=A0A1I5PN53_9RHOB|nr:four-helix bundle copper-binding protein [Tranquillimonas alkanivorans]SFP35474.1 hypothetical protein SAMN04488047_105179 [Tranquillimonas alkanivorans]
MQTREIIATHPSAQGSVSEALVRFIDEAFACAQTCTACADACLAEEKVAEMRRCIRLNLDCADICAAAGKMGSRRAGSNEPVLRATIEACAAACRACGDECSTHAEMHEHCRICAEACKRCADACDAALADIG